MNGRYKSALTKEGRVSPHRAFKKRKVFFIIKGFSINNNLPVSFGGFL